MVVVGNHIMWRTTEWLKEGETTLSQSPPSGLLVLGPLFLLFLPLLTLVPSHSPLCCLLKKPGKLPLHFLSFYFKYSTSKYTVSSLEVFAQMRLLHDARPYLLFKTAICSSLQTSQFLLPLLSFFFTQWLLSPSKYTIVIYQVHWHCPSIPATQGQVHQYIPVEKYLVLDTHLKKKMLQGCLSGSVD